MLIAGWNAAGWMDLPGALGDRIAPLIGAAPGTTMVGDTLSLRLYQALGAALNLTDRKVVLGDTGNFPSDLYMARGLLDTMDAGHELRLTAPEAVGDALTDEVGVLMLTQVDYRTGRMHDMAALTERAHSVGALTVWDLAHSAGAVEVDLLGSDADFAVGCTYKYLNGGPGAPAFITVAPRLADRAPTVLNGWLGHAAPFDFDRDYRPAAGIARMRVGTPAVIQLRVLDAALDIWDGVEMAAVRAQSIRLSERFIAGVEARCPALALASPRDPRRRGSQVSFRFDQGHGAMRALIGRGVIGDFRAPDVMRFGFAPLYLSEADVDGAVDALADVLAAGAHPNPAHRPGNVVT